MPRCRIEVDAEQLREALLHGTSANIFYLPEVVKIDLFGHAHGPFDESEFSRRQRVVIRDDGRALFVKTAEDTILRKLWWYVQGGQVSERQWRDVLGVLRAHPAPAPARRALAPIQHLHSRYRIAALELRIPYRDFPMAVVCAGDP